MKPNPFLEPFRDPFEDQLKEHKERTEYEIEFQRLCYELFLTNPDGKRLMEMATEQFLIPGRFDPTAPNAQTMAIWWDGFKEAIRGFLDNAKQHKKRIAQGGQR